MHRLTTPTGDYQVALLRSDCTSVPQALVTRANNTRDRAQLVALLQGLRRS